MRIVTTKSDGFIACIAIAISVAYGMATTAFGSARVVDACQFLTPAEISSALRVSVLEGQRQDLGFDEKLAAYSSTCIWLIAEDRDDSEQSEALFGGRRFVILNAMQWAESDNRAHEYLEGFYRAARSGELPKAPVPRSLGEESLWWGDGLAVREGNVSFAISVFPTINGPQSPGLVEEQLAGKILAKLSNHQLSRSKGND